MSPLPWYKSPVYIGIVVNIIAGIVNILGFQDLITLDFINSSVTQGFTIAALVAAVVAEWKRRRSAIQPISLTKKE
jgi:riboflavin transporter FmnP